MYRIAAWPILLISALATLSVEAAADPQSLFDRARRAAAGEFGPLTDAQWREVALTHRRAGEQGHRPAAAHYAYLLLTHPVFSGAVSARANGIDRLHSEIRKGNVDAMVLLAYAYEHGHGLAANTEAAQALYVRAAAEGSTGAMRRLAERSDGAAALRWLIQAADQGDAEAAIAIARALRDGSYGPADPNEAKIWFERAQRLGHPEARAEHLVLTAQGEVLRRRAEELDSALAIAQQQLLEVQGRLAASDADRQDLKEERRALAERLEIVSATAESAQIDRDRTQLELAEAAIQRERMEADLDRALSALAAANQSAEAEQRSLKDAAAASQELLAMARAEEEKRRQELEQQIHHARHLSVELAQAREASTRLEATHAARLRESAERDAASQAELLDTLARLDELQAALEATLVRNQDLEQIAATNPARLSSQPGPPPTVASSDGLQSYALADQRFKVATRLSEEGAHEQAMIWLHSAAEAGHPDARARLQQVHLEFYQRATGAR